MTPTGRRNDRSQKSTNPAQAWSEFLKEQLKANSKIGKAFEKASFAGFDHNTLTFYFEDETTAKKAKGQIESLKTKLPSELRPCDRVDCKVVKVPSITSTTSSPPQRSQKQSKVKDGNPLQSLNFAEFGDDGKGNELSQPVLAAAVQVEQTCSSIYTKLCQRTELLAGGNNNILRVSFNWRLRVGGTRGFRELLLPVFHPVFGVPYIPSSSLKGAARAWARDNGETKSEISKILGMVEGKVAKAAKVEFLDAFPTKKCLSVDVATPQWTWQNNNVVYKPEPHPLLSLESPQILIGLRPTKPENDKYIPIVREWLENALKSGIGSRVSSGYGRALGQASASTHKKSYGFELWTQGMYGSEPPSKQNSSQGQAEFRPTAIRGILRYWFRSLVLSFYGPAISQELEDRIFGKLSQQGAVSISVVCNPALRKDPYRYNGTIYLEAKDKPTFNLLEKILVLASHLGGAGRGSRRPLHLLDVDGRKYMRGCDWAVDAESTPLKYDSASWQQLFTDIKTAFTALQSPIGSCLSSPGQPGKGSRRQDVLDTKAQVWLVKSPNQIPPDKVSDWGKEGLQGKVRGSALELFYSDDRFKGQNKQGKGNSSVGGTLGTPSFVWIKSVFPRNSDPYQVVTIFGVDQPDRLNFAKELEKLAKSQPSQAILVFGKMPTGNPPSSRPTPSRPIPSHPRRR
ncbi:RAMP superfamily CRISPR-associated protein [Prochlorothrix hollandica]|uniref:RAMP superfamily CRISPR-associated protein n=1 Tax=Prochlorothrix hollandica TaxID=1223 RepID=UPI00034C9F4F|nr:RAMP superfamily CRISPR-associated protein [Prochlorothrix hollandica]